MELGTGGDDPGRRRSRDRSWSKVTPAGGVPLLHVFIYLFVRNKHFYLFTFWYCFL